MTRADLLGRPWLASFVFLQCDSTCSAVASRVADVAARVPGDGVRFVSFSVDSGDDRARLARYRAGVTHDRRWRFTAADATLPAFAVGMGAATSENDVPSAFVATGRYLFLVDADGVVQRSYDGLDDGSARRIVDDLAALGGGRAAPERAAVATQLPRLWPLPPFSLVDQHGRRTAGAELRGRPLIADFIFTSCAGACPLLTARMVTLQQRLAGADVGFVSFSVDPEHDTPAALADYARRWHADPRWRLFATTRDSLRALAAGMRVPANLAHSDRFFLVDASGMVRGAYDSTDDAAVARLTADARRLAPPAKDGTKLPPDGAALFSALGCAGCHDDRRVAAPLDGLWGTRVTLDDGRTLVADDAYVRESIVDPRAKIAAGWPPSMPSYAGVVDGAELDALVAYVESLRASAARGAKVPVRP